METNLSQWPGMRRDKKVICLGENGAGGWLSQILGIQDNTQV